MESEGERKELPPREAMSILDSFIAQQVATYNKPEPQALVKYEKPKTPRIPKAPKTPKSEVQAKPEISAEPAPKKQPSNPFLGLQPGSLLHFPEKFLQALVKVQGQQVQEATVLFQYQGYSFQDNHGYQLENQVRHAKGVLAREKGLVNSLRAAPIARVVTPLAEKRNSADDLVGRLELSLDELKDLEVQRDSMGVERPEYAALLLRIRLEKERIANIRLSLRRLGIEALRFWSGSNFGWYQDRVRKL